MLEGFTRYAFFGAQGDLKPYGRWYYPHYAFEHPEPTVAGYVEELSYPILNADTNPLWAIDCQYGEGIAYDLFYTDGTVLGETADSDRALAVEPTWPRGGFDNRGAMSPSVIQYKGGVSNFDDPLNDTETIAVQLVMTKLAPSGYKQATLIARGDVWKVWNKPGTGFVFTVTLDNNETWSLSVSLPNANIPGLLTCAFVKNGAVATISSYYGYLGAISGRNRDPQNYFRSMQSEDWSDNHTGDAKSLMDASSEPLTLLNSWCGRNPYIADSGEPAAHVACVRVLTNLSLPLLTGNSNARLLDSDDATYDGGGGTPFRADLRAIPALAETSNFGTVALRWTLNEDTGAKNVFDSGDTKLYNGKLTSGVEWDDYGPSARSFLVYPAAEGDTWLYLERTWLTMRIFQLAGPGGTITVYNADRSDNESLTLVSGNLVSIRVENTPNGDPSYRVFLAGSGVTNVAGWNGGYPDDDDAAYVELASAPNDADVQPGVKLAENPPIGACIRMEPKVPPFRYLMAYTGRVFWKEFDKTTITGKAICLAVAGDLPGPWVQLSRNWPVVVSFKVDTEGVKDIDHPALVVRNGTLYLLWSQEATANAGDYEIYGMELGDSWDKVIEKHVTLSETLSYVADSATSERAMKKGLNTAAWDGNAIGSVDAIQMGRNVQAVYSGISATGEWEIGVPRSAGNPLAMLRANASIIQDTTEAGGVSDPSSLFYDGQEGNVLVRSMDSTDLTVVTGKLVLLSNPDGLESPGDDTGDTEDDRIDEWDETSTGEKGSANAIRGATRWRSPSGTYYTLVAAGANIYKPIDVVRTPGNWTIDWGLPQQAITDSRIYVRTARAFVDFVQTPDAVICCIPGETEPARWNEDELLVRAGVASPNSAPAAGLTTGGSIANGNYKMRYAFTRKVFSGVAGDTYEYGSMSAATGTLQISAPNNKLLIDISNDWGPAVSSYVDYRCDGIVVYLDREVNGAFTGNWTKFKTITITTGTTVYNVGEDDDGNAWPLVEEYGSTDRGVPPPATTGAFWKDLVFYDDPDNESSGWNSTKRSPGTVPEVNRHEYDAKLTAYVPIGERILAFTEKSIWYIYGEPDDSGGGLEWDSLSAEHGTPWSRSACKVGEAWAAFWFSGRVYLTNGNEIIDVGRPLKPYWDRVFASYWDRVVLTYYPVEDMLVMSIPYRSNIPLRGAALLHPLSRARKWTPLSNFPFNCFFINEFGELIGGDSRYGKLYECWTGGHDDGEEIEAWGQTSVSYGRAPETHDCVRYLSGDVAATGGQVEVAVTVDRGKHEWLRGMRVDVDPSRFGILANGPNTAYVDPNVGINYGQLDIEDQLYGQFDMQPLPGHKGRTMSVQFRFRGRNQSAVVRDLALHMPQGAGRWGSELGTGRADLGLTRIRWRRFDSVNMQDDPSELPSNVLCAGDNLDFREHGAARVRPGRRNILLDNRPLNSDSDGSPG
ncbi:MAG: hypothetical protein GY700_06385 [Propionibacteriaceae bacterium]|nr:hypothetical protein [Propionibacteriaceae bacterium]